MKICFCIGTLSYSGAEKVMYYMIEEFVKHGDDVSVILLSCDKPYEGLEGVIQYPIYGQVCKKSNRITRTLENHRCIRNIVKKQRFDIIVSFGVIFNVDVIESCFGLKANVVLCERNDPVHDPHSKLLRFRRYLMYRFATGFVFQTDTIKGFFSKKIQKRSMVIPNFIERTVKEEERYSPQRLAIATSARLDDRQKDQSTILKAFSEFHKTHADYYLEFYGDGPDRKKLEELAKKLGIESCVFFKGRVSEPMQYIRTAKLFLLSSVYEGMPNSLIEAMAYGMPCISSDCGGGGARELIRNGENGLLVGIGEVDELVEAMRMICDEKIDARKLGEKAAEVNSLLRKEIIIERWIGMFQKTIKR